MATDSAGNVYFADQANNVVDKVDTSGNLTIVAGTGSAGTPRVGFPATLSPLNAPETVAVDTVGNLYIADASNNVIEKVDTSGTLSIIAGIVGTVNFSGTAPGSATVATLTAIGNPYGLAVDSVGNVFVADSTNRQILKITPAGLLSLYAGSGGTGPTTPGLATSADLYYPEGMVADASGNLYVAVEYGSVVAKIDTSNNLTIVAGNGNYAAATNGSATSSSMEGPTAVAFTPAGDLVISDGGANQIYLVHDGQLQIIAGDGTSGAPSPGGPPPGGSALASAVPLPYGLAVNPVTGVVYVSGLNDHYIVQLTPSPTAPIAPTSLHVVASGGSTSLSFTAPTWNGGSPITGYEYSTDGGATWHTLSYSGTTAIVGTVPGTGATSFAVRAVNSVGSGDSSQLATLALPAPALAATGTNVEPWIFLALLLLAAGIAVTRLARPRTSK